MKKMMIGAALALAVVGAPITALAGEVNGNGRPTQGPAHANSICTFSGLADGGEGEPSGPGAPPQNWGHIPKEVRAELTAIGEYPGRACNGHLNPLQAGGGEP